MYTKCFSTLICCVWAYEPTLTLLCLCRLGEDFREYWGRPEPEWCCNFMVEAQTPPVECIPHPYDMYAKCFNSLRYAMNGHMGPPSYCCAYTGWGWIIGDIGVDLRLSDIGMEWLMLQTSMDCIPYPYWMCKKCFSTLVCYEWAYRLILTVLRICRFAVDFLGYWGRPEPEGCCNVMVEAQTPHGVHLTSIWYVYKVF